MFRRLRTFRRLSSVFPASQELIHMMSQLSHNRLSHYRKFKLWFILLLLQFCYIAIINSNNDKNFSNAFSRMI